jgi:hypothetical protein
MANEKPKGLAGEAPKAQDEVVAKVLATKSEFEHRDDSKEPKIYKLIARGRSASQERRREGSSGTIKTLNLHPESVITEYSKELGRKIERRIRYCPGESSIYVDEQSDSALGEHILFEWGVCVVQPDNINLTLYMEKTGKNLSSENRRPNQNAVFYEVNPTVAIVQNNITSVSESRVINWLDDTFYTEAGNAALKMYARTLGVSLKQKDHAIQNSLIRIAKQDPKGFLEGFASQAHARKYYLMTAEENGIIKADRSSGVVTFNGNNILTAPPGEDPIDYLVRYAIDTNGAKVYDAIKQKVDAKKVHDFTMAGNADMEAVMEDVKSVIDKILRVEAQAA